MSKKRHSKDEKYKNVALTSKFTETGEDRELPLPSLEDIRDSEKTEFFSVSGKEGDNPAISRPVQTTARP